MKGRIVTHQTDNAQPYQRPAASPKPKFGVVDRLMEGLNQPPRPTKMPQQYWAYNTYRDMSELASLRRKGRSK